LEWYNNTIPDESKKEINSDNSKNDGILMHNDELIKVDED
jgi:hypothetical protein